MAKVKAQVATLTPMRKKTSIGGNNAMIKKSSMNKSAKRGFKKYRGQGR